MMKRKWMIEILMRVLYPIRRMPSLMHLVKVKTRMVMA